MATLTIFDKALKNLGLGKFVFGTDTMKLMLSDTAPNVKTAEALADITEIAAGNGYSAGGATLASVTYTETGTNTSIWELTSASPVTFTASGGSIAQFRYLVLYDATQSTPTKPLWGYLDYGSEVNLSTGQSFSVNVGANGWTLVHQ